MISSETIKYIQGILKKIANGKSVSLEERIYIQNVADEDQKVNSWLKRAKRHQNDRSSIDAIDNLINDLDLGPMDSDSLYRPNPDDLGHWFSGAPSWVSRS